jgi:ABC-type iron transport system FetAB permease component
MNTMLFLAVTTLDKVKGVPPKIWGWVVLCVLGFFLLVFVLKRVAQFNKIFLGIAVFVALMFVAVQWIYNRNEPAFLTPFVDQIAPFFPTAGAYAKSEGKSVVPVDQDNKKPPPPPPSHVY